MRILGIANPFLDRTLHIAEIPKDLKKDGTAYLEKGASSATFVKEEVEYLWKKYNTNEDFKWSLGGSGTNVVMALSCLINCFVKESSCALFGMVGKDKKEEVASQLKNFPIESRLVEGNADNGIVNCFVTPDSERTMQAYVGVSDELSKEHIHPDHFEKVSHVHLEGYLAYLKDVLNFSALTAKEKGATTSLDLSSTKLIEDCGDQLKECAAKVDIIFGNLEEMITFTGCKEEKSICDYFSKEQIVVITNGAKGGWFKDKNTTKVVEFNAIETKNVIDTTGAGDFFTAGFLAGFLAKKDIESSIKIATLAASYVIQQDGTKLPNERWEELQKQAEKISR